MAYRQYLRDIPDERWVRLAYQEQITWALGEDLVDIWDTTQKVQHNYFFAETYTMMMERDLPWNAALSKNMIKTKCLDISKQCIAHEVTTKTSLRYMDGDTWKLDHGYNSMTHKWWLKARVGGIFTRARLRRNNAGGTQCPVCGAGSETLEHFLLECPPLNRAGRMNWRGLPDATFLDWALSIERSGGYRTWLSAWIQRRWRIHERLRQEGPGGPQTPPGPPGPLGPLGPLGHVPHNNDTDNTEETDDMEEVQDQDEDVQEEEGQHENNRDMEWSNDTPG